KRRNAWEHECGSFLDLFKAKLFVSLKEGALIAFGKQLSHSSYSDSIEHFEGDENWLSKPWAAIPSTFWVSTGIDWEASHAEGKGLAQALILVETDELLRCFPPPPATSADGIANIAGTLVQSHRFVPEPIKRSPKGRPSLNWDQFHVEVARRLKCGAIP